MPDEALGENRAYYLTHGYHADILRDSILKTLPSGWRDRLVPLPGTATASALEPHDLTAVKLPVGIRTVSQSGMADFTFPIFCPYHTFQII